ncbi:uncharacterized protein METZ01_LOCUS491352, partial [marine metagenome]
MIINEIFYLNKRNFDISVLATRLSILNLPMLGDVLIYRERESVMKKRIGELSLFSLLSLFFGISVAESKTEVNDTTLSTVGDGRNWAAFGRNYSEQRYSPLTQIDADSVKRLGVEWVMDLPDDRSLTGTPLVVDGVMYFTGSYSKTKAVDAKSGKLIW